MANIDPNSCFPERREEPPGFDQAIFEIWYLHRNARTDLEEWHSRAAAFYRPGMKPPKQGRKRPPKYLRRNNRIAETVSTLMLGGFVRHGAQQAIADAIAFYEIKWKDHYETIRKADDEARGRIKTFNIVTRQPDA